jgi:hypothetical protein
MKRIIPALLALAALAGLLPHVVAASYTFTNIVDNTTSAPFGTFDIAFGEPALSGGIVAFRGRYFNPDTLNTEYGIFTGNGGPLTTIAKTGDLGPTGAFGNNIGHAAISGGVVAFGADYRTSDGMGVESGVFKGSGGPLTTIATTDDAAPAGTYTGFGSVSIDGSTVAFKGSYPQRSGIFRGDGGALAAIVKTGDAAPIGSFDFNSAFLAPAISGETVAFGAYSSGINSFAGIVKGSGGPLTTIVEKLDPAPSGTFTGFGDVSISGQTVAFAAIFDGSTKQGIFAGTGGPLTTIAKSGDAAPSGVFLEFGNPSISGISVAFTASFDGKRGLFTTSGGPVTEIISSGDSLFGSTITNLSFQRFGLDPFDGSSLAFEYELADGRVGIAMANVVPEASGIAITSIALLIGLTRARIRYLTWR